ncbi:hypothetical protein QOZ80_4BG0334440 [Eleusine coracana subsp. coracana]|nr:hypothetical protein QOZ80_4BG0334440 [Eleusine coracana subsp. coracana]
MDSSTSAVSNVNVVASYLNNIEPLNGANYPDWRGKVITCLAWNDLDIALRVDKPAAPVNVAAPSPAFEKWERSDRMATMVILQTISTDIKGVIPTKNAAGVDLTARELLATIEENFKSSSKTYASTLIMKLVGYQYNSQTGIREHILHMCDMINKLKDMKMEISDGFLVYFIMTSLPPQYAPFKISYNTNKNTWSITDLISYCVEEEERLKTEKMKENVVNMVDNLSLNNTPKNQHEASSSKQGQRKKKKNGNKNGPKNNNNFKNHQPKGGKSCSFCGLPKHLQKACPDFKKWLKEQGISFDPNYKKGGAKPKSD